MNDTSKLIIVGAGPAGLAAAIEATNNSTQTLVFERSDRVGGLSRTMQFEDCLFDVGPHRFYTKNEEINALFDEIVGEDLIRVKRLTRIFYEGKYFNYPITPINALLGLGVFNSIAIFLSYAAALTKQILKPYKSKNFE